MTVCSPRGPECFPEMGRAKISGHVFAMLREVDGFPDAVDFDRLSARIMEALAAEHAAELAELQIGADRRSNVGGTPGTLDGIEDGAPPLVMLEQAPDPGE